MPVLGFELGHEIGQFIGELETNCPDSLLVNYNRIYVFLKV
jgi:hypothetical protein